MTSATKRTASFRVSFADHPGYGPQQDYVLTDFGIVPSDNFQGLEADRLVAALPEILRQACVKAAARHVDYEKMTEAGKSDSDYLDLCDRLASGFAPTAVVPVRDIEPRRFRCNGIYLDSEGDGWTGLVMGADEEEAKFQAKWQMALACAGDTRRYDDFAELMDGCGIDHVAPEPVTTMELAEAARDLVLEIGGHTGEAQDRLVGMLGRLGIDVDRAPAPGM
jgi:hypothetical protein